MGLLVAGGIKARREKNAGGSLKYEREDSVSDEMQRPQEYETKKKNDKSKVGKLNEREKSWIVIFGKNLI